MCFRDKSKAHHSCNPNRQISNRCHHPRTIIGTNTTAIFIVSDISNVMNSIFYFPMPSIQLQQSFSRCLFLFQAGYSISGFYRMRDSAPVFFPHLSLYYKKLVAFREISTIVYLRFIAYPDSTNFYPSVSFVCCIGIRLRI